MKRFRICSSVFLILGLCALGYADEHFPFIAQVAKKSVNIRAGANTNFEKVGQLNQGDEIVVLGKSFDWYKVQLPSTAKAFIRADYLKITQNSMAELIGDNVNMRAAANSDSASLGMIKKGQAVKVIAQVNDWWQIEPPVQAVGWIRQDFLTLKSAKVDARPPQKVKESSVAVLEVKGRLKLLTEPKDGLRYELMVDDATSYYVQSIPSLDRFKGGTVVIKGFIVMDNNHTYTHAVLHALTISLLL
jgi:uncharacterized protein YgiM (DUF1202 family)